MRTFEIKKLALELDAEEAAYLKGMMQNGPPGEDPRHAELRQRFWDVLGGNPVPTALPPGAALPPPPLPPGAALPAPPPPPWGDLPY